MLDMKHIPTRTEVYTRHMVSRLNHCGHSTLTMQPDPHRDPMIPLSTSYWALSGLLALSPSNWLMATLESRINMRDLCRKQIANRIAQAGACTLLIASFPYTAAQATPYVQ